MIDGVWIALYRLAAVNLRTLEILKVKLGKASIEIWFSKPWLCIDDHVEPLYGKNIVLVV